MLKSTLESIITRYYLNGIIESTKYVIKDKSIVISFTPADNKSLIGKVTYTGLDIPDATIGIMNTSQLLRLIKILDHNIEVTINQDKNIADKMIISDNQYDMEYYLADLSLIKNTPKVKEPKYDLSIDITNEFIPKFTNATKALNNEVNIFNIEVTNNEIIFKIGTSGNYSNKIQFKIPLPQEPKIPNISPIPFSADLFNEVLLANRKPTLGTLELSKEGLIKTTFQEESLASQYFLIRLEDI